VDELVETGTDFRALVRNRTDAGLPAGVELVEGDLADRDSLRRLVAGADTVFHCAAKVGDWGPWLAFKEAIVDATAGLLDEAAGAKVGRFVYFSSIIVYGHPHIGDRVLTEEEPLGQRLGVWEYYARAKIQAEELCRKYPGAMTILRPSWMYGARDQRSFKRFFGALKAGRVKILGSGDNLLNAISAADVADAAVRAADAQVAVGQAYNVSSEGEMTQRQLLDMLTDALGIPRITRRIPLKLALFGGLFSEAVGKLIALKRPPHVTRYAVRVVTRSVRYSTAKAREQLGWAPKVSVREGIMEALRWYQSNNPT
jgi:nucleoside-diphosphate-sugar epimerase